MATTSRVMSGFTILIAAAVVGAFMLHNEPIVDVDTTHRELPGIVWYAKATAKPQIRTVIRSTLTGTDAAYDQVTNNTQTGYIRVERGEIIDISVSVTVPRGNDAVEAECYIQMQGKAIDKERRVIEKTSLYNGVFCSATVRF